MEATCAVLARTQRELQGLPCMDIEEVKPDRQQIMVSRSFGERIEDHDAVHQAIATFAVRACEQLRRDLFTPATIGNEALMATVDRINRRFGGGAAGFGASGWQKKPDWGMRQNNLSPCYTTRWSDLPSARC